ncbi:MAG: OsmC family peroxiredoxin [Dehalococcoidia bacterium]|nr:OsmC family peroxiredoxin [Dehalococcoidia bacterium]
MEETRWTLRVRAGSKGPSTIYVRRRQFQAGEPLHFDPEYAHATAVEYLLAAIGADLVGGLQVIARRQSLQMNQVEAVVSGKLNNPLTYLGVVGEEGHPGLEQVAVTVYVSSAESEARIRQAWDEMLKRSPLVNTLKPTVRLDLTVKLVI